MTKEFIEQQRLVLLAAFERISGDRVNEACTNLADAGGVDTVDAGAAITAANEALAIMGNSATLREDIARALNKIDKGTYGICELFNTPISEERLVAIPWARFSIEAQREFEKNRAKHGAVGYSQRPLFDEETEPAEEETNA